MFTEGIRSDQIRSVAQSCPTLCDPMNRSTPGLPGHHQLPEFTHVHRVSDAIQPSHPLSSPSPLAPNPSQHQSLFQWVNSSHKLAKAVEFFFCRLLQIILENRGGTNKQWCSVSLPLTFTISCLNVFFFILSYYLRKTKILCLFPSPVSLIFCCLSPCHVILNKDKIFLSWKTFTLWLLLCLVLLLCLLLSLQSVWWMCHRYFTQAQTEFSKTSMSVCEI